MHKFPMKKGYVQSIALLRSPIFLLTTCGVLHCAGQIV